MELWLKAGLINFLCCACFAPSLVTKPSPKILRRSLEQKEQNRIDLTMPRKEDTVHVPVWPFPEASPSPDVHTECVAAQHRAKNGNISIICTVLHSTAALACCVNTLLGKLFPLFTLHHPDVTLRLTRSVWTGRCPGRQPQPPTPPHKEVSWSCLFSRGKVTFEGHLDAN